MNRQDGRCTAAYESKAFPFFTFNVHWSEFYFTDSVIGSSRMTSDSRVARHALLHRMRFVSKYRGLLDLLDIDVDDTGGFHSVSQDAIDFLMVILRAELGIQKVSWVMHEAL